MPPLHKVVYIGAFLLESTFLGGACKLYEAVICYFLPSSPVSRRSPAGSHLHRPDESPRTSGKDRFSLSEMHEYHVHRYAVKPCGKEGVTTKSSQFAENAKKGFLNQVFCKGFIIHHPLADGVNAAGVLAVGKGPQRTRTSNSALNVDFFGPEFSR
jgi:hypothetical protein